MDVGVPYQTADVQGQLYVGVVCTQSVLLPYLYGDPRLLETNHTSKKTRCFLSRPGHKWRRSTRFRHHLKQCLTLFKLRKKLFNPFEFPDLINYLYYSHVYWYASHAWSNVIWDCWIIGPRARPRLKVPSPLHHTEFPHQRASPGPDGCCRIRSKELQTFHGIFSASNMFFFKYETEIKIKK